MLSSNSGRHLLGLGRALHARGFNIQLTTPTVTDVERAEAQPLPLHSFTERLQLVIPRPALVHLWTPRLRMERLYQALCRHHQHPIPYLVHLEDNERILLQDSLGLSAAEYRALADGKQADQVPENRMHPLSGDALLRAAAGITALARPLLQERPGSRPAVQFWPGYETRFEHPSLADSLRLRAELQIPPGRYLTAYTGNVHASNLAEVRWLYQAVDLVNRAGLPLTLLRTGRDGPSLIPKRIANGTASPSAAGQGIAEGLADLQENVINLGQRPREQLPSLLRAADILVQPGRVDDWNRCRVPSKLPEYLAACRPVVMPRVNLGEVLSDGKNAVILDDASAEPIAAALIKWLPRKRALLKIGVSAGIFARRELSWERAAERVGELYNRVL